MKRVSKVLLMVAIMVLVLGSDVEGAGRPLKKEEKVVDQPQNFLGGGGISGLFPSPGFTGVGFGPSGFCTFPGGCTPTPALPTIPGFGIPPPHA